MALSYPEEAILALGHCVHQQRLHLGFQGQDLTVRVSELFLLEITRRCNPCRGQMTKPCVRVFVRRLSILQECVEMDWVCRFQHVRHQSEQTGVGEPNL